MEKLAEISLIKVLNVEVSDTTADAMKSYSLPKKNCQKIYAFEFAKGNSSVKQVPFPKVLSTFIFPLCASTIVFT